MGVLDLRTGTYKLELNVLNDSSCLNQFKPTLRIATFREQVHDFYLAVVSIFSFALACGTLLVIRSYFPAVIPAAEGLSVTGTESFKAGTLMRHRKPRREPRKFSDIPSFGLIASWALLMVLIPVWIINTWLNFTHESQGVLVYMPGLHPQIQIPPKDDFPVLRLEGNGNEIRFLVNSKPVANHEVKDLLNSALKVRKARFVYLSVDPELDYSDAAQAIDIIRSVKAEVILYTPKMGGPDFKPPKPDSSRPLKPVK